MGSGICDWIYWHFFTITINYDISQPMTVSDSLHSLLDQSVFSSTVTNDERRISAPTLNSLNDVCQTNLCLNSPSVLACPPFIISAEPNRDHHFQQFTLLLAYPLLRELCVNSVATFWFHYSGFQAVFPEPLLNNGRPFWFHTSGFQASCHNIFHRYHLLILFVITC
jgi:hypothetical protein